MLSANLWNGEKGETQLTLASVKVVANLVGDFRVYHKPLLSVGGRVGHKPLLSGGGSDASLVDYFRVRYDHANGSRIDVKWSRLGQC